MTDIRPGARCGDADRDQAIATLREAHSGGFIDTDEFTARMGTALGAVEKFTLDHLTRDLTRVRTPTTALAKPKPRRSVYKSPVLWLVGACLSLCWCIFTVVSARDVWVPLHSVMAKQSGAGFFIGGVIGVLLCAVIFLVQLGESS